MIATELIPIRVHCIPAVTINDGVFSAYVMSVDVGQQN